MTRRDHGGLTVPSTGAVIPAPSMSETALVVRAAAARCGTDLGVVLAMLGIEGAA